VIWFVLICGWITGESGSIHALPLIALACRGWLSAVRRRTSRPRPNHTATLPTFGWLSASLSRTAAEAPRRLSLSLSGR